MAQRRRVRGDRAFRRLLKKIGDETIREEMLATLDQGGDAILAAMRADATVSSRVRGALSKRVLRGSIRLRVGLVGRPVNRRLWWARVIEKGRKAQTVIVNRGSALAGGIRGVYQMRVSSLRAKPFTYSQRVLAIRDSMGGQLRTYWERVLAKASGGLSDE